MASAWAAEVELRGDVCRDGGGLGEISGAASARRDAAAEPRLSRLLLGFGQTGAGGPTEGGGKPYSVPENRKQGGIGSDHRHGLAGYILRGFPIVVIIILWVLFK